MWYIALTKPRQEQRAKDNLENQGAEVFLPLFRRETIKNGKRSDRTEPLFPGYIFLNLELNSPLFSKIRSTFGVNKLLTFGQEPIVIADALIDDLRLRTEASALRQKFNTGQQVQLKEGPFKDYQAIFKEYKGSERAVILIGLLGQQNELVVALKHLD